MTISFKDLRKYVYDHGPTVIQWHKSLIIEVATLEDNGAIRVTNVFSNRSFIIPRNYVDLKIRIVPMDEVVPLGSIIDRFNYGHFSKPS